MNHNIPRCFHSSPAMDSQFIRREGRLALLIDRSWREDIINLPHEEIKVPPMELPDPEPDTGNSTETLREQEMKWTDLALGRITSHDSQLSSMLNQ